MSSEMAVACALIDNMRNKATEQEIEAIDFVLKVLGNNVVAMDELKPNENLKINNQYLDLDEAVKHVEEKLKKEISTYSIYKLFRKRDFPKKRIGKKFMVTVSDFEKYMREKENITWE